MGSREKERVTHKAKITCRHRRAVERESDTQGKERDGTVFVLVQVFFLV